ncbi:hypothetical protein CHX26_14845 [Porphyrobacter sp. HT-58-2]|nr:hypothetical protein CHX26_14845 [Porphyrobacter sp. HT-58-2]
MLLSSCTTTDGVAAVSQMAVPLELQAIQAREFNVPRDLAFKSVMSVLQDLGYILQSADLPSGFISAVSPSVDTTPLAERLIIGSESYSEVAVTASFLPMPNGSTKVRLNFVERRARLGLMGKSRDDRPVIDPEVYQVAWEKVDETLFMLTATNDLSRPVKPGTTEAEPTS